MVTAALHDIALGKRGGIAAFDITQPSIKNPSNPRCGMFAHGNAAAGHVFDDAAGDIHARRRLDPSSPGEEFTSSTSGPRLLRIRSTPATPRPSTRGAHRGLDLGLAGLYRLGRAAAMQVGTESPLRRLPAHRRDHRLPTTKQRRSAPFASAMNSLHQEMRVQAAQGFRSPARGSTASRSASPRALGAFVELDHVRRRTEHRQQVDGVVRVVAEHGHRQV